MWGHFHHASKDTDIFRRPKVLAATVSISRFPGWCVILPGCGSFWSWWPMSSIAKLSTTNSHLGFPGGANSKEPAGQCRRRERLELDPWVRKIPWRRDDMATHSRALARRIPWTEEPGGLQSMGSKKPKQLSTKLSFNVMGKRKEKKIWKIEKIDGVCIYEFYIHKYNLGVCVYFLKAQLLQSLFLLTITRSRVIFITSFTTHFIILLFASLTLTGWDSWLGD